MKKLLLFMVFLLAAFSSYAQINRDLWFKGVVELENGELIDGSISYYSDYKAAMLQIRTGGKTLSYDANKVLSFRFFDEELNLTRRFYSLPYIADNGHQVLLFFEALLEGGHLSALSKTEFKVETRQAQYPYSYRGYYIPSWYQRNNMRSYSVMVPYETIYLVTPDTDIEPYSQPTSMLGRDVRFRKPEPELFMQLVKDKRTQVEQYLAENKLDLRKREDLLRAVQFYNEIKDQGAQ